MKRLAAWIFTFLLPMTSIFAAKGKLTLASTTSTQDSGLFDVLIPAFEKACGCSVRVIAVGTGQAIRLGRDGNADVLLVHDPESEEKFVSEGYGEKRLPVMHNDFFIVGPREDPAEIRGLKAVAAFRKMAEREAAFVSRGDESGTHKKEKRLWQAAGAGPGEKNYFSSGSGMETALRIANERKAYCLVDRATWLAHRKEIDALDLLVQGDPDLYNPYAVIVVSAVKAPWTNYPLARKFVEFIRGPDGQRIIRDFGKDRFGSPLFFPDVIP